jgi:hypothetical protein
MIVSPSPSAALDLQRAPGGGNPGGLRGARDLTPKSLSSRLVATDLAARFAGLRAPATARYRSRRRSRMAQDRLDPVGRKLFGYRRQVVLASTSQAVPGQSSRRLPRS